MFIFLMRIVRRSNVLSVWFGLMVVVTLSALCAFLFGGRQPVTTALDVGLSALRIGFPFLVVFCVQDLIYREFDRKLYCLSLSYPVSRFDWLLSRVSAALIFFALVFLISGFWLAVIVGWMSGQSGQATSVDLGWGYLITLSFVWVDFIVLISFSVFISVVASTPSFILVGTLGFMFVARSFNAVVALLEQGAGLVSNAEGYRAGLGGLGYMLPDLGSLDVRMLALYGKDEFLPGNWFGLLVSSFCYAFFLLGLSFFVLSRKRLG